MNSLAARIASDRGPAGATALSCAGVGKSYDGIEVLRDVTLSVERGTLTVLVGENGAGKSTLFRIISGQASPDRGTIAIGSETVGHFEPRAAAALGVSIIPQELLPIPHMRVYENLLLGRELRNPLGLLRRARMKEIAHEMLQGIGLHVDPDLPMRRLNIAQIQLIEILKATTRDASIVLMDEPTSSLSAEEREHLFSVITRLKRQGVAILYTSHKMEEIEAIADNVAVLRDGHLVREAGARQIDEAQLISDMVGRSIDELFPHKMLVSASTPPVLEVRDLLVHGFGAANNFAVRPGEIVGLGGLAGAGRSEMMEALFGLRRATGDVTLGGDAFALGSVAHAIRRGIAMVPEDRKQAGVLTTLSILDNISLPYLGRFVGPGGWVHGASRRRVATDILTRTGVRYARLGQKVVHLSGGNQQKIALARWLVGDMPRLLILDEPTRGIDIAARSDLYRLIAELAARGVAILLASSDMPELLGLSHRVLVMRRGSIVGELASDTLSQEAVLRLAMGASR